MDVDLSLPFRQAARAKVVNIAGGTIQTTSTWKILIVVGVALFLIYYFFVGNVDAHTLESFDAGKAAPQTPAPNSLEMADAAYERYEHESDKERKAQQYNLAVTNYLEAANTPYDTDTQGKIMYRLAVMYHGGVPELIAPDAQQAILFYREAIKFGYHGAVLPLASVYHWGLTGFEGNREVAKHLYGVVLKTGTDYEKGLAKDRLRQMREEEGQSVGNSMLEDSTSVTANFGTNFGSDPYAEHFMDFDKSPFSIGRDEATRGMDEKYVDDLIQNKLNIHGKRREVDTPSSAIRSDPQNARDHVVVNSVKQSLERLRANTNIQYDVPTTFKMIHEYIVKKSDVDDEKREKAAQVLRELSKGMANSGFEQAKEIEALHLVWNRIHSQVYAQDTEKRHVLCENLVGELAECIEYGELVCPTGRIDRIVDTLNYQDPIVNIQPKWAVQQTMVMRAGAIEKSLLTKARPDVRDAMASVKPNARQRQLQTEFMQKVKSSIERDLTRRYVDTGMMSKELLKTEIDAWML